MKQFSLQYISSFCMSLHLAMQAGISIHEGVSLFESEETERSRRDAIRGIAQTLETGEPLAAALRKAGAFPAYMVDMVEVGEKTGKLDDTLLSLSRYYDRQDQMSKNIRSAVTYPAMLLLMLLVVLVIFVVKVLPIFSDVYDQLGTPMSGLALGALNVGRWIGGSWLPIVVVIAVIILAAVVFRKAVSKGLRRIFMGGKLGYAMQCARFAGIMSMTMSSGMSGDEGLHMAARLTQDRAAAEKIEKGAERVGQGESLAGTVADMGIFPKLYNRMLSIGVQTGSSDRVMEEIARRSGDEANDRLEAFIGRIEPSLVIVMSALVGLLLLSVMLPLAGIMSAI